MFGLNQSKKDEKKNAAAQVIFTITDMHCSSCAINIDGALEDTNGVLSASTNYAQAKTTISYDAAKTSPETLQKVIGETGYHVLQL